MTSTLKILTALTESLSRDNIEHNLSAIGGISIIDLNGTYLEINDKYANTCGYLRDELIGKNWAITVHPDDLKSAIEAYERMKVKGEEVINLRGIKKNGSTFEKTVTFIKRNDIDGNMIGHYCLMNEI